MTSLISLIPASTALKETNSELVRRAMTRASVVLPQPGGPQKSIEPMLSASICMRSGLPGPRSFSWPMNSSSVRGRMRSASGWLAVGTSESAGEAGNLEKRLMDSLSLNRLGRKGKWSDFWRTGGRKRLSVSQSEKGKKASWLACRAGGLLLTAVRVALAGGFVEDDGGGSSGVEGLNAAGHGNADAGVGPALDFLGEAGAFVADEESDGLAPVDFPRGQ